MPEAPQSLVALMEVAVGLARRTASGKVLMARYAEVAHADLIPPRLRKPVRAELEGAWDQVVAPVDDKVIKGAARRLDAYESAPVAVTPTAQVHFGELDGEPVALKVARPGVAAQVRAELSLLDILAAPARSVFPSLDVAAIIRDQREQALDELDLEHEGEVQHQVRRALRRVDGVTVPAVHAEEIEPGVLVTEKLDGPTLKEAAPDDPSAVARLLIEAHIAAWRDGGYVLTDSRPGHVVLLEDGGIGLLGTGLARLVDRERATVGVKAFEGLTEEDPALFVGAVEELGILPAETAITAHALLREILGPVVEGPVTLDGPLIAEITERAFARVGDLMALAALAKPQPEDLAAARMLGQLAATLSRLGATEDWPALAAEIAGP